MSFGHDDAYYALEERSEKFIKALKQEKLSPQGQAELKEFEKDVKDLKKEVAAMP